MIPFTSSAHFELPSTSTGRIPPRQLADAHTQHFYKETPGTEAGPRARSSSLA